MEDSDVDIKDESMEYLEHQDAAYETEDQLKNNTAETCSLTYTECPTVQPEEILVSDSDIEIIDEENYSIDCLHCSLKFFSEANLNEHYKSHHFCKLCKKLFNDDRYFYTHILDTHINFQTVPVSCQFCTEEIIENDILKHMKEHAFSKIKYNVQKNANCMVEKEVVEIDPLIISDEESNRSGKGEIYVGTVCKKQYKKKVNKTVFKTNTKNVEKVYKKKACKKKACKKKPIKKTKKRVYKSSDCKFKYIESTKKLKPPMKPHNLCKKCFLILEENEEHICFELCYQCNARYSTTDELLIHVKSEHFKRDICEICKLNVDQIPNLAEHVKTCVVEKGDRTKYICKICNFEFKGKKDYELHTKQNHFNNDKCEICDMYLFEVTECIEHLNGCLLVKNQYPTVQKQLYCCFRCHTYFNSKTMLEHHIYSIHVTDDGKCVVCKLDTEIFQDITEHFKCCVLSRDQNKNEEIIFKADQSNIISTYYTICKTCSNDYITITGLRKHYKEYPYGTCINNYTPTNTINSKKLKLDTNDESSVNQVTPSTNSKFLYNCMTCKKKFITKSGFEIHLKSNHECEYCTENFKNQFDLINHLISTNAVCTTQNSMKCKFCNIFITENFVEHLKSHILEKYRTCEKCSTVFPKNSKHFTASNCFPQSQFVILYDTDNSKIICDQVKT